jgi:hypothetical protein
MSLGPSGNPATQGRKAQTEADAAKRTDMALREVMATPAGRRALWAIVNTSGVFGYTAAGAEPKRDYGVFLIDWFQRVDTESYLLMQSEAAREASQKQELDRAAEKDGENDVG